MQVLSSKADVTTEYDGKELQGFAAAFGIFGHPRKGDGEAITSDWCLLIKPADAAKAIKQMQKLGFSIEDQRKEDGYINFTGAITSGTFSFDCFKKGDCALTVSSVLRSSTRTDLALKRVKEVFKSPTYHYHEKSCLVFVSS